MSLQRFSKTQPFYASAGGVLVRAEDRMKEASADLAFKKRLHSRFFGGFFLSITKALSHVFGPFFVLETREHRLAQRFGEILGRLKEEGAVYNVEIRENYHDLPKVCLVRIKAADSKHTDGYGSLGKTIYGLGISTGSVEGAMSKALGEIIERLSLIDYREKALVKQTPVGLERSGRAFVDPKDFFQVSDKQITAFKLKRPEHTDTYLWTYVRNLLTNTQVLIPAQTVYWTYRTVHDNWREPHVFETNTNGCAVWSTRTGAIVRGIYELVERDGFLIYWLNELSPRRIEPASFSDPELQKLYADCRRYQLQPHFLVTTTDLKIPSITVALVDETDSLPKVVVSACAAPTYELAAKKALLESLNVYIASRRKFDEGEPTLFFEKPEEHLTMPFQLHERVRLWADPRMFQHFQFFIAGEIVPVSSLVGDELVFKNEAEELALLLQLFREKGKGYEVYCYDSTYLLLREYGLYAVKVVVPEIVHMYFRERTAPLGAKRIAQMPRTLGLTPREVVYPWPHPFP